MNVTFVERRNSKCHYLKTIGMGIAPKEIDNSVCCRVQDVRFYRFGFLVLSKYRICVIDLMFRCI